MEQGRLASRSARGALPQPPCVITEMTQLVDRSILSNALLLLDKPRDWEDQEVVRALSLELSRVRGKGGRAPVIASVTGLETSATGLMVTLLGSATKLTNALHDMDKVYTGVLRLGQATRTYDATSAVVQVPRP